MKRVWASTIVVTGIAMLLVALYFMFGAGEHYKSLSKEEAAKMMENNPDCLVVDVRTQTEYDAGHIPSAICVPIADIREGKVDALPDKYQVLLIYCYAGRRAVDAAKILTSMGYRNTYEFGGIVDWKGPVTDPLPTDAAAETSDADVETSETVADAEQSPTDAANVETSDAVADAAQSPTDADETSDAVADNPDAVTEAPETN